MFRKILIANRGEIALRIIRACRELGIQTVAVYSEADRDSLHVRFADEDVCIGPPLSTDSYLNIPRIIAAAEVTDADAIHPGYGFLAENARFAEICESCDIKFIGASPDVIRRMGNKAAARRTMMEAGVPVIPGTEGLIESETEAMAFAREFGYPIMIKAAAGGGGKGMRVATDDASFTQGLSSARAEAEANFGDGSLYLERMILGGRHIEIQLMGDSHGNVVHFGERDCSVQRRHQKLIEEAPSPIVTPEMREAMGEAAVRGARNVNYEGAGTIEFLVDKDNNFFFMEMNTRIQVEHPVTEQVTGVDLVKLQIRVAAGEEIPFKQEDVEIRGHAMECRINAENPDQNFMPSPGHVNSFHMPGGPGIRVDTHAHEGYTVSPHYDSMIAKVITFGKDRSEAISRMKRALRELVIEGIWTTVPFHLNLLDHPRFVNSQIDVRFVDDLMKDARSGDDDEDAEKESQAS